jgi:hypothetical protein
MAISTNDHAAMLRGKKMKMPVRLHDNVPL